MYLFSIFHWQRLSRNPLNNSETEVRRETQKVKPGTCSTLKIWHWLSLPSLNGQPYHQDRWYEDSCVSHISIKTGRKGVFVTCIRGSSLLSPGPVVSGQQWCRALQQWLKSYSAYGSQEVREREGSSWGPFITKSHSQTVSLGIDKGINICEVRALMIQPPPRGFISELCYTENSLPSAHELRGTFKSLPKIPVRNELPTPHAWHLPPST